MKLAFIAMFLIAIGVSVAIVINPLNNKLQGAWIVSVMGTGLRNIFLYLLLISPHKFIDSFEFRSFSVFFWYFAAVMYSLYKSMKVDNTKPQLVCEFNNEHVV